jgi:hypothetical protein
MEGWASLLEGEGSRHSSVGLLARWRAGWGTWLSGGGNLRGSSGGLGVTRAWGWSLRAQWAGGWWAET